MPETDAPHQACPACGGLVDVSEAEPLTVAVCPTCGEKFRVERTFDHFVLVETLGVGGMGSVYKARDTRLDRFVALKLLRKELSADPVEAARLEQEARVTASVNHPNVVQVFSAGSAHGQIYLVIELVDHGSLDDLIAQHTRVPEVQVLRAGIQVAEGLQAAHAKGLIHRDVKPANILFTNSETAKIGDFGLAVAAGQKSEIEKEIWGTPYYVAPERLNNETEDFRSDIYSLGATLYHALAGQPPISAETTSATELRALKNHPPDLRAIAPEISRATARAVTQMLAPNASDRFASYSDLITALEVAAGPAKAPGQKGWRIAVAVLALIAVAGLGFYLLRNKETPPVPILPVSPSMSPAPENSAALRREEQARVARAAELERAEKKAREAERKRLFDAESPGWEKALADARGKIAVFDFPAALAAIEGAQVTEPSLLEALATKRKKIGWLIAWKRQLLADLTAGRFKTPIEIGGASYTGATKADDARITFRLPPYGTADVDWVKIPPKTLLAMSVSLIQPNGPDAADRQWLSAVFAHETGQNEASAGLAEGAVKAKPGYRDQLRLLSLSK